MMAEPIDLTIPDRVQCNMEVEISQLRAERDEYKRQANVFRGVIEEIQGLAADGEAFDVYLPSDRRVCLEPLERSEVDCADG